MAVSFVFLWCSNGNKFVTENSNDISRFFCSHPHSLIYDSTNKTKTVRIERKLFSPPPLPPPPPPPPSSCSSSSSSSSSSRILVFMRLLGRYAASTVLIISSQTFRRELTVSVDSCVEIKTECPFSGVINSGRVWRKVPGSDARGDYMHA